MIELSKVDKTCVICGKEFAETDERWIITDEPILPYGKAINGELVLFHKGNAYHPSCE